MAGGQPGLSIAPSGGFYSELDFKNFNEYCSELRVKTRATVSILAATREQLVTPWAKTMA